MTAYSDNIKQTLTNVCLRGRQQRTRREQATMLWPPENRRFIFVPFSVHFTRTKMRRRGVDFNCNNVVGSNNNNNDCVPSQCCGRKTTKYKGKTLCFRLQLRTFA